MLFNLLHYKMCHFTISLRHPFTIKGDVNKQTKFKRSLSVTSVVEVSGPVVAAVAIMVPTDIQLLEADGVRHTSSVPPQQLTLCVVRTTQPLVAVGLQHHTRAQFNCVCPETYTARTITKVNTF